MTQKPLRSPRAALLIGAALLATPAFAQDGQTVAPPPVVATVPQASPTPAPAPSTSFAPSAPVVQAVPDVLKPQTPPRETARTATRATAAAAPRPSPRAAAPAPAARTAPAAQRQATPAQQPAPTAVSPTETAPVAPTPDTTTTQATSTTATTTDAAPRQNALWPWLLGGALIVAGVIAMLLFRRRREDEPVYEEAYEPVHVADPAVPGQAYIAEREPEVAPIAAAAPVVIDDSVPAAIAEEADLHDANAEDLADLTAAAPVAHRPWLEFGMRPVRAGTSSDEALVEVELTVANSGDEAARDVRISAFLLKDANAGEMERMLTGRDDTTVPPVTIPAGEGTRVDATLALRRDEVALQGDSFSPLIVADARYTLPDGSEGRTAATFRVGLWNGEDGIEPIALGRPQMHDNVAAELAGTPEHA